MEGRLIKGKLQFSQRRDNVEFIADESGDLVVFESENQKIIKGSIYFCGIDSYDKDSKSQSKGFVGKIKK